MPNPTDQGFAGFSPEQVKNARAIIEVGLNLGASQRDIRIALMVALTESGLRNVHYGDRDSLGLFQQRDAWGTEEQRMDPRKAARMFFLGGHAGQRGLFDFADRDQMSLGQAAQAVQVSAFPDRYATFHEQALDLIKDIGLGGDGPKAPAAVGGPDGQVGIPTGYQALTAPSMPEPISAQIKPVAESVLGVGTTPVIDDFAEVQSAFMPTFPDQKSFREATGGKTTGGWRQDVIKYAKQFIGTPYVWGGTSPDGFDCSGLMQYIFKHIGVDLPRISADQASLGHRIDLSKLKPGDLVGWDNSSRNNGADHIALYLGNGMILEAPRPGLSVQISSLYDTGEAWGVHMGPVVRG